MEFADVPGHSAKPVNDTGPAFYKAEDRPLALE